ncbi:MAG: MBL fold metallo-hydrolase [Candidatus Caldatribacteriaceae bacterium]
MRKVLLLILLVSLSLCHTLSGQALEIRYLGHSAFLLTFENGLRLVLDPFSPRTGYPTPRIDADILVSTHEHFDHYNPNFLGKPAEILSGTKENGKEWNLFDRTMQEVRLFALPSYHDQEEGKLRGKNSVIVIEGEDMRLAHLGDIGALPNKDVVEKLRGVDVLFTPVGGNYTISLDEAEKLIKVLSPRIIIPMHYRTPITRDWPLVSCEEFLSRAKAWKAVLKGDCVTLQKGDLPSSTEIWVLKSPGE